MNQVAVKDEDFDDIVAGLKRWVVAQHTGPVTLVSYPTTRFAAARIDKVHEGIGTLNPFVRPWTTPDKAVG